FVRADSEKLLRSIRTGAERTATLVRDLRTFSRAGGAELEETDLAQGMDASLSLVAPLLKDRIVVERRYAPERPRVRCHAGHLNQVFMNLLTTAAQAIPGRGTIVIGIAPLGADRITVRIADSGPGVPAAIRHQIFDPFFTTKEVGAGVGLGLTISESIVRDH